jgi:hypothetical protein
MEFAVDRRLIFQLGGLATTSDAGLLAHRAADDTVGRPILV